jgi:hypothetical protein
VGTAPHDIVTLQYLHCSYLFDRASLEIFSRNTAKAATATSQDTTVVLTALTLHNPIGTLETTSRLSTSAKPTVSAGISVLHDPFTMKASIFLSTATVLAFCLSETTAFVSPAAFKPALHVRSPNLAHTHTTALAQIHLKSKYAASTTIAGNLWPTIKRFKITAALGKEIVRNVMEITHWQDIALLSLLAFGSFPLAKFTFKKKLPEDKKGLGGIYQLKRFGASALVSQIGTLALSVYAVDVISVVLTTLGFQFPVNFGISAAYAKLAYTGWALQRFLLYKRLALCRFYKVDEEDMGRVEIFDRLLNGLSISLVALVLFDWLSVKMGIAMKGVFAFGSVGTLALTLGSQKLVAQVRVVPSLQYCLSDAVNGHGSNNVIFFFVAFSRVALVGYPDDREQQNVRRRQCHLWRWDLWKSHQARLDGNGVTPKQ